MDKYVNENLEKNLTDTSCLNLSLHNTILKIDTQTFTQNKQSKRSCQKGKTKDCFNTNNTKHTEYLSENNLKPQITQGNKTENCSNVSIHPQSPQKNTNKVCLEQNNDVIKLNNLNKANKEMENEFEINEHINYQLNLYENLEPSNILYLEGEIYAIQNVFSKGSTRDPITLPIWIEHKKILSIIDSGASSSLISHKLLIEANPKYQVLYNSLKTKTNLYGVSGTKLTVLSDRLIRLFVPNLGDVTLKISVIDTEDNILILGRDFMNKSKLSIVYIRSNTFILKFQTSTKKNINSINLIEQKPKKLSYKEIFNKSQIPKFSNFKKLIKLSNLLLIQQIAISSSDFLVFMTQINKKHIAFNINCIIETIINTIKTKKISLNLPNIAENETRLFSESLIAAVSCNKIKLLDLINLIKVNYTFMQNMFYKLKHYKNLYKFIIASTFEELTMLTIMLAKFTLTEKNNSIIESKFESYANKRSKIDLNPIINNKINYIENSPGLVITEKEFLSRAKSDKMGIDIDNLISTKKTKFKDILEELKVDQPQFKEELAKYIIENKIISRFEMDCGALNDNIPPLDIEIDPGKTIYKNTKSYRLDHASEAKLKTIMSYMCARGLAKISPKGFGAPVFLIPRPDPNRMPRLLVDNRKNNAIIKNACTASMPECFSTLKTYLPHAKWLTIIDLKEAFYALKASEKTMNSGLLNILTPWAAYTMTRVITGSSISPTYLIYNLTKYLHMNPKTGKYDMLTKIINFYDDICILNSYNQTLSEHIQQVKDVLERLAYIGFKINAKKSRFYIDLECTSVQVLGYEFGKNMITIPQKKLIALQNIKMPESIKDLQAFLGSINYFRNLLPLNIHGSLNYLYRQTKNFIWSQTCTLHFNKIINALKERTMKISAPFKNNINILLCDGSKLGIGGTLISYCATHLLKDIKIDYEKFNENNHFKSYIQKQNNFDPYILAKNQDIFLTLFIGFNKLNYKIKDVETLKENLLIHANMEAKLSHFLLYEENEELKKTQICQNLLNYNFEFDMQDDYVKNMILYSITIVFQIEIIFVQYNAHIDKYTYFSFNPQSQKIYILYQDLNYVLLYFKENTIFDQTLPKFDAELFNKNDIRDTFYSDLKNGSKEYLENKISIIGFYSQSIQEDLFRKSSICYIELLAIFSSLEYFETDFTSDLIYILTDSSVAYSLLTTSKVQKRSSKLEQLSQKLFCWYQRKNIFIVKVEGLINFSDFLSRLLPEYSNVLSFKDPTPIHKNEKFEVYPLEPHKINTELIRKINLVTNINNYKKFLKTANLAYKLNHNNEKQLILIVSPYKPFNNFTRTYTDLFNSLLKKEYFVQLQIQELQDDLNPNTLKYKQNKIYLPIKLYMFLIGTIHGSLNHPGIQKLYNYINAYYYVQNKTYLLEQIRKLNNNCLACLANKNKPQNYKTGSIFKNHVYAPNYMISSDLLDLPKTMIKGDKNNVKHLLVIQDVFSKYVTIYCLPKATQTVLIHAFANYFSIHGLVRYHLSDNASIYRGHTIQEYFKKNLIKNMNSSPLFSKARGFIERTIGKINNYIRLEQFRPLSMIDLASTITEIAHSLNQQPLHNTFLTPYNVHFISMKNFSVTGSDNNNLLISNFCKLSHNHNEDFNKLANVHNKNIVEYGKDYREFKLTELDKINKNKKDHSFRTNDTVLIKNVLHKKLFHLYHLNLFRITRADKTTIVVENLKNHQVTLRKVNHIKKIEVQDIPEIDLPQTLINRLKILTKENIESIFEIDILPENKQLRRSKRINPEVEFNDDNSQPTIEIPPEDLIIDRDIGNYINDLSIIYEDQQINYVHKIYVINFKSN